MSSRRMVRRLPSSPPPLHCSMVMTWAGDETRRRCIRVYSRTPDTRGRAWACVVAFTHICVCVYVCASKEPARPQLFLYALHLFFPFSQMKTAAANVTRLHE